MQAGGREGSLWDPGPKKYSKGFWQAKPSRRVATGSEYDEDDMMTWYTNAYGLDGIVCSGEPTLEVVTRFLANMAAGVDYGMTPD